MKNIYSLFFLFLTISLQGQAGTESMPIALSYMSNELSEELTETHRTRITTKVMRIIDRYGFIAAGAESRFGIFPRFDIIEKYEMQGLRKMQVVKAEFTLHVKQLDNGVVFGSVSKTVSGTSTSKEQSIRNAINEIPVSGKFYQEFLDGVRIKLNQYYSENCAIILSNADKYYQVKEYAQAVSELLKVPAEAGSCQDQVKSKLGQYYQSFQEQHCAELLQVANAKVAAGDYDTALEVISVIDPTSSCGKKVESLLPQIEGKATDRWEQRFELLKRVYTNEVELEKYRIEAIREIGKSYYTSRNQPEHWMYVINH